jgi:pyrroline-5-carboxylate reductase
VTSPNGTTQAGLDVLDGDGLLSSLLRGTVRAAAERSRVLAAQADSAADPGAAREAARAG